jgi:transketolase
MNRKTKESTRVAFAKALLEAGRTNPSIVTVAADSQSRFGDFVKEFPERSINVGIAEQTMVGVAAGFAISGYVPVITSYANFLAFRALEQIRVDIASELLNVKMIGTDTGFASAWLGFTHLALEDVAAISALPGIVIIDPADAIEAFEATKAMLNYEGPVYMRIRGRKEEPILPTEFHKFEIGKARVLKAGNDVMIVACGSSVYDCLEAANILKSYGIDAMVVNMATIRPLDEDFLLYSLPFFKKVVTVECHNIKGGLGSSIAELLSEKAIGTQLLRMGVRDRFGTAGADSMLKKAFLLDSSAITNNVREFLNE